ncbi:MAG: hypothetical protein L6Q76_38075 [Polyangiaceae bacterium]|nr:hypothetical protein [Polyangiaceae bacterium]
MACVEDRLKNMLGEVGGDTQALGRGAALFKEGALARGVDEGEMMAMFDEKKVGHKGPSAGDKLEQGPVDRIDSRASFQEMAIGDGRVGHGAILAACSRGPRAIYRGIR